MVGRRALLGRAGRVHAEKDVEAGNLPRVVGEVLRVGARPDHPDGPGSHHACERGRHARRQRGIIPGDGIRVEDLDPGPGAGAGRDVLRGAMDSPHDAVTHGGIVGAERSLHDRASGMMLFRTPPWMLPMLSTTGARVMSDCRLTMVWSPSTICEPTTIGSIPSHGLPPCVCTPRTTIRRRSEAASSPSGR